MYISTVTSYVSHILEYWQLIKMNPLYYVYRTLFRRSFISFATRRLSMMADISFKIVFSLCNSFTFFNLLIWKKIEYIRIMVCNWLVRKANEVAILLYIKHFRV